MNIPLSPLSFLERARRLFPDRVGVIDGDLRLTYEEFAGRCHAMAAVLADEHGVSPGDRVAWLSGNTLDLLAAYYGVLLAEAVLVPLNIRLAPIELRAILDDVDPRLLVLDPAQPDPGHSLPTVQLGPDYEARLGAHTAEQREPPTVDEDTVAEIFYTSGSTGGPKGVMLTHRALYLHAVHSALTNAVTGEDVILHTIPLYHVNGWGTPHYVTGLGGVHVMLPRFHAGEVLSLVEKERVSRLFLVPTMAAALLEEISRRECDLSSVTQVSIGGAPAGIDLIRRVEEAFGCSCICGYGMTESSPTLTRSLDKPGEPPDRARRATTGLPIIGVDLRVFDAGDREMPWDGSTAGEICARSNHVMSGYWGRPDQTAEALRGGWLRTGDIATVDPDGYVTIVDRKKDIIISGGENISSVEVEKLLAEHPAVIDSAVVAVPDERWGEVPRAFVTLRPDSSFDGEQLRQWARERMTHFKVPREIIVLDALPLSGTGKVRKDLLRDWGNEVDDPHSAS